MTPMLDMIFIILIFLLVSAHFSQPSGVEIQVPIAGTAQSVQQPVVVTIDGEGQLWVGQQATILQDLASALPSHSATSQRQILLAADQSVATGRLLEVLDFLRSQGWRDIAIAAAPGKTVQR